MSWQPAEAADCKSCESSVELVIEPRERDLGGFSVRRILPAAKRSPLGKPPACNGSAGGLYGC